MAAAAKQRGQDVFTLEIRRANVGKCAVRQLEKEAAFVLHLLSLLWAILSSGLTNPEC